SHCNALTRPAAGDTRDTKNTRNTKREHKQNVLCSFLCGRRVLSVLRAHGSRRRVQRDSDDRYDKGTDCPASTQMYSQAAPPASARSAARVTTAGLNEPNASSMITGSTPPPI